MLPVFLQILWSLRNDQQIPLVTVPARHACAEFKSERLYILNGKAGPSTFGTIGGLHKTRDGYIRMHDGFPNHRENALKILGLKVGATREDVSRKMLEWKSLDLETKAIEEGAVMAALRSFEEWDALPQSEALSEFKDVLWITSISLPDLPDTDVDVSRGKRTIQLNIKQAVDKAKLLELVRTADVFIQSYRPGSLAAQGLSNEELLALNPRLVIASLNAYGPDGPWSQRRGFDSLVQTCSGINVADAERYGDDEAARVLPCQALDHGSGYLLATGVMAALYKQATEGGSYEVKVSLAGVMRYLRSLGQYEGKAGFDREDFKRPEDVSEYLETRQTDLGEMQAVRHAARIHGLDVGWEHMPKPLGSDEAPKWEEDIKKCYTHNGTYSSAGCSTDTSNVPAVNGAVFDISRFADADSPGLIASGQALYTKLTSRFTSEEKKIAALVSVVYGLVIVGLLAMLVWLLQGTILHRAKESANIDSTNSITCVLGERDKVARETVGVEGVD
ncbi:hypothetical protein E8E12_007370 [Didymella heteroderae]|uniref:Uncharacterized protein n=1 Tax=Didymella heteroderae TaxID=1769908 RepID=A0A9P5BZK9_9PLEO|nr:hypothetical protein E8E12_007370 [Didymella heteroderae]